MRSEKCYRTQKRVTVKCFLGLLMSFLQLYFPVKRYKKYEMTEKIKTLSELSSTGNRFVSLLTIQTGSWMIILEHPRKSAYVIRNCQITLRLVLPSNRRYKLELKSKDMTIWQNNIFHTFLLLSVPSR